MTTPPNFASDIPTYAHHLRRAGYQTCLSGKMHFVGPDQLHGFEERLTTDIYPADFGWTPDYRKPGERIDWWYHNLGSVTGAGVAEITNQMEYDDEVAFQADQKLYDLSRGADARPWCLTVSFTHPHDPYRRAAQILGPVRGLRRISTRRQRRSPTPSQDPHSQRLLRRLRLARLRHHRLSRLRRARQGYFANISYIDDKVGELLDTLEATAAGGHDHPLRLRPRRHAGRARPVVQDELLRRLGPRAADDRRPRAGAGPHRHPGLDH